MCYHNVIHELEPGTNDVPAVAVRHCTGSITGRD